MGQRHRWVLRKFGGGFIGSSWAPVAYAAPRAGRRPAAAPLPRRKRRSRTRRSNNCGSAIPRGQKYCRSCAPDRRRETIPVAARLGRLISHSAKAQASRAESQKRQHAARKGWVASDLPPSLDKNDYLEQIQPRLTVIPCSAIASALGVSHPYAAQIRAVRRIPHPRHWEVLAGLVDISLTSK